MHEDFFIKRVLSFQRCPCGGIPLYLLFIGWCMCYNVIVFDWADPARVKLLNSANSVKFSTI